MTNKTQQDASDKVTQLALHAACNLDRRPGCVQDVQAVVITGHLVQDAQACVNNLATYTSKDLYVKTTDDADDIIIDVPQWFILQHNGVDYLVDTQHYKYCRYMAVLVNNTPCVTYDTYNLCVDSQNTAQAILYLTSTSYTHKDGDFLFKFDDLSTAQRARTIADYPADYADIVDTHHRIDAIRDFLIVGGDIQQADIDAATGRLRSMLNTIDSNVQSLAATS